MRSPCVGLRVHLDGHDAIDLEVVVVPGGVELGAQIVDEVRVGDARQLGRRVIGLERVEDFARRCSRSPGRRSCPCRGGRG